MLEISVISSSVVLFQHPDSQALRDLLLLEFKGEEKQGIFRCYVLSSSVPGPEFVVCFPAKFKSYPLLELFGCLGVCTSS